MIEKAKIKHVIIELEQEDNSSSHPFVPHIIKSLRRMLAILESKSYNLETLKREAAGLGKGIMDDDAFAQGPIGKEIGALIEEILRM